MASYNKSFNQVNDLLKEGIERILGYDFKGPLIIFSDTEKRIDIVRWDFIKDDKEIFVIVASEVPQPLVLRFPVQPIKLKAKEVETEIRI